MTAPTSTRRRVLIFSPDADLARTLVLSLEETYSIERETSLGDFGLSLQRERPNLILVDLFTFSEDVNKLFALLDEKAQGVPVITLRGYIPLRKETNKAIEERSTSVFYKPVDVDLVSEAIESLLGMNDRIDIQS